MFKYFSILLISANSRSSSRWPIAIRSFHPEKGVQFKTIGVAPTFDADVDRAFRLLTESIEKVGLACENMSCEFINNCLHRHLKQS